MQSEIQLKINYRNAFLILRLKESNTLYNLLASGRALCNSRVKRLHAVIILKHLRTHTINSIYIFLDSGRTLGNSRKEHLDTVITLKHLITQTMSSIYFIR